MTAVEKTAPSSPSLARRLFREHLSKRRGQLALSIAAAGVAALMTAALGSLLDPIVNRGFDKARFHLLVPVIGLMLVCALVRGGAQVIQARITNAVGHRMVGEIQSRLFGRLVRADLAQLRAHHSGSYIASVLYDAGLIREAATTGAVNYTQQGLTVIFCIIAMAFQDPALTVIVLIGAPVSSLVMRRFSRRTTNAAKGAMDETSALSTAVMESLDGIKVVKIENQEAFEEARVAGVIERRQRHIIRGANARATAAPATETLTIFVVAAVLLYAGWRAQNPGTATGHFVSFLALLMMASQALRQVANLQTVFAEGLAATARLFAALDVGAEVRDAPAAPPLVLDAGTVRVEDVSFAYAAGAAALEAITLEVRRGETVALVGPSGGGKSTLLNLIPRFYDVSSGRVCIDGQDVREVGLASLRSHIALVTQEPFLFDDTLRANIAYARPEASLGEVVAAAKAADAHGFISALPDGYETRVGEAGARLSGGQRQRIAIARAFLKDAPILLLDEATSALDTESELRVQAALERLMTGRATILIAHRLSTVRSADRIYVLQSGRIVEEGPHAALVARRGLYARRARAQNLDLDPEAARAVTGG